MSKITHLSLDESGGLNRRRIHLREISDEADAPLETIGQDLRAARLRRGDDLASVSKVLNIRKNHLEALEEDRLEALPGRTYAIGFVRAYAEYLGLDAVQSVERFKREIAGREEPPQAGVFSQAQDERQLPHGWVIIAIVVLGLIVYGAYRLARSADDMLNTPVAPVPARMALPAAPKPKPKPQAQPVTPPVLNGTAAAPAVPATGPATNGPAAATGRPAAVPAPAPALGAPQAAQPAASQPPAAALPNGHVYGEQNANARVVLHVLKPTRVFVKGNNGNVFINRDLKPGDSYRVPDFVGLTLSVADGAAVALELDGQPMGLAGRTDSAARGLSLDPQAIVDRYNAGQAH
ncbi:MAG: DUF4115 domain-containing protein [Alphaproteobacteria bacterium]|nr:DUF4115 domain-containing protein [Alphaproteobacteria bacterium]MDE2011699.1 DUF4115 domain-containing protein [Alphaproteobacteria bacterium]